MVGGGRSNANRNQYLFINEINFMAFKLYAALYVINQKE